jgi:hypothetical protein
VTINVTHDYVVAAGQSLNSSPNSVDPVFTLTTPSANSTPYPEFTDLGSVQVTTAL